MAVTVMAVMASQLLRWREGAGKRACRLSSPALASKLTCCCSYDRLRRWRQRELAGRAVVTAMAKPMSSERPKSGLLVSDGRGTASMRALRTESNQIGPKYEQSEAVASQQQRLKYLGHTVGVCYTNMREPLAKQCQSKSRSNNVLDKQNL